MTYRTRLGGPQMLVIAAGGHSQMRTALGDYVVAYRLGGTTVATEGSAR
jgi:glucose dehydrogenase